MLLYCVYIYIYIYSETYREIAFEIKGKETAEKEREGGGKKAEHFAKGMGSEVRGYWLTLSALRHAGTRCSLVLALPVREERRGYSLEHTEKPWHTHTTSTQLRKETNPSESRQNTQFRKHNSSQRETAHISSEKTNYHDQWKTRLECRHAQYVHAIFLANIQISQILFPFKCTSVLHMH